jgi:hypothetical protein
LFLFQFFLQRSLFYMFLFQSSHLFQSFHLEFSNYSNTTITTTPTSNEGITWSLSSIWISSQQTKMTFTILFIRFGIYMEKTLFDNEYWENLKHIYLE